MTIVWILLAVFLLVVSIVAFSLPWTEDSIEAWLDDWQKGPQ
jgi:hypothetical protein